jgi:hypothetical protein
VTWSNIQEPRVLFLAPLMPLRFEPRIYLLCFARSELAIKTATVDGKAVGLGIFGVI